MMRRRAFLASTVGLLAAPLAAEAQPPLKKVPRIGLLISETVTGQARRIEALRAGLRDRGYVEGQTIAIEVRAAEGGYERLSSLAAELVRLRVDVIVAFGIKALVAAKTADFTAIADDIAQALGDLPQQVVTGLVAHRVVDVLEPVEVEHHQGAAAFGGLVGAKDTVETSAHAVPVREAGE